MTDELSEALLDALVSPVEDPASAAACMPLIVRGTSVPVGMPATPSGVLHVPDGVTFDVHAFRESWRALTEFDLIRQASRSYEWLTCCSRCGAVTTLDGQGRERCLLCRTGSPAIQRFPYARNFVLPFVLAVVLFTILAIGAGQGWLK